MKTKDFDSLEKRVYFWVFTGEQKRITHNAIWTYLGGEVNDIEG